MTAEATVTPAIEDLLEQMLTGDQQQRRAAWLAGLNAGLAGVRVADHRCGSGDVPFVRTWMQLWRHLVATDSPAAIRERGYRMHTPVNVTVHDPEEPGIGPALGRGGGYR